MRGVLPFRKRKSDEQNELSTLLHRAKTGDSTARNLLIESYIPFVLRIASQASHRYIDRTKDDEFSIALYAFNEAIDRFDDTRNVGFLGFAETIIRRRLIDYFRSQKTGQKQVPWSEFDVVDEEDNITNYVETKTSIDEYTQSEEQSLRAMEISEYALRLQEFNLSFSDLVELSPKHEDARQNAIDVSRCIVADEKLLRYVLERKSLPLKDLENRVSVSRKTMERQRKYIIAVVVLLTGEFPTLQSFIS